MEGCIVQAIYDFQQEDPSDLGFFAGDIIKVTKHVNEEWYFGMKDGETGQFPSAFVKVVLKDAPEQIFIAIADFKGQEEGDIEFKKDDIIGLGEEIDENWIVGLSKESSGLCPKSFLKELSFLNEENNEGQSINDVEKVSKNDSETTPFGESVDEFSAQTSDELSFPKGARIDLVKEIDSFWTEGVYNGTRGRFPSMFVKPVIPLPSELLFSESRSSGVERTVDTEPKAKALFLYVGANADELSFDKGDTITLLHRIDAQWYQGQIGKSVGLFPANHVDILVDLPYEDASINTEKAKPSGSTERRDKSLGNDRKPNLIERKENHHVDDGKINEATLMQKPSTLKPKPSNKPKISQQKPAESKLTSKVKPTVLTSLKQQKQQITSEEISSSNELGSNVKGNASAITKPNETVKRPEAPIIIKAKKSRQPPAPGRPPAINLPNGQVPKAGGQNADLKPRPKVAAKPKPNPGKPPSRATSLDADMPLFNTSKVPRRPELTAQSSAATVSPNVALLEQELSSLTVDENDNNKVKGQQVNGLVGKTDTKQEERRIKRPAPTRPSKEPLKPSKMLPPSANLSNGNSPLQSPTLPNKGLKNGSLTMPVRPNKDRSMEPGNRRRPKGGPPQLPKPLAPQPPKKPPVSPRYPKCDASEMGGVNLGFEDTVNELQEKKEPTMSTFYVDFIEQDSVDGQGQNARKEIEMVEKRIVQIRGRIESESSMLSGIENMLACSEDEDKMTELRFRQRSLSTSLMDLNEELFAYQDEKSYLLASSGDSAAIKSRIDELAQQIVSYRDNCAKLHRMKNVATKDEVAEIKDGIEFCENMVEALSEELALLKQKLEKDDQERQKQDPAERRKKLLCQREKAVEELIKTERDYIRDIDVCATKIFPRLVALKGFDGDKIFGNLEEICKVSKRLLASLEKVNIADVDSIGKKLGKCFVDVTIDLTKEYSSYCRSYDESQMLLEKLEQDNEIKDEIFNAVNESRDETRLWDLSSYLIKPVQRILKYPLLLKEIYKFSPEDEADRESIQEAITALLDVATAINEFKRRKDIVRKYIGNESIGNKIQRLNWHSVRKKSSRINQKINQRTGLVSQTVDEQFVEEERRFRAIEKIIKNFIRSLGSYLECFQESNHLQKIVAENIKNLCEESPMEVEVLSFYSAVLKLKDVICPKFMFVVKTRVMDPLERLLQLFVCPLKLIEKREDKCLDYDRMLNRVQKTKEAERSKQAIDELTMAKKNYAALNSQLLEELPRLSKKCLHFFHFCLSNFVKARYRYFTEITDELTLTFQLNLIERCNSTEIVQRHGESVVAVAERISQLLFYPDRIANNDGSSKLEPLTLSRETFSNFYVDMLFDSNDGDPTSPIKPAGNKGGSIDASEPKPVPLPRRKSLRRSSSSRSPSCSPVKSPGFSMEGNFSPTRRHRVSLSEEQNFEWYLVEYSFEREDAAEISVDEGAVVRVLRKHDKEANPEWWLVETSLGRGYVPSAYLSPWEGGISNTTTQEKQATSPSAVQQDNENREFDNTDKARMRVQGSTDVVSTGHQGLHSKDRIIEEGNPLATDWLSQSHEHDPQSNATQGNNAKTLYRALYDFKATEREELSIIEGDVANVLKIGDDNGNWEWSYVECKGKLGYVPFNYLEPLNGFAS